MTVRVLAVLQDGTTLDDEYPNHDLGDLEIMVKETENSLFIRIEIEDSNGKLIHQYKKEVTYAY